MPTLSRMRSVGWRNACEFMEEWAEWVDPQVYINESTVFFDENEVKEHYESAKG